MRRAMLLLLAAGVVAAHPVSSTPLPAQAGKQVPLLLAVGEPPPLGVDYRTEARRLRSVLFAATLPGIVPALIAAKTGDARYERESAPLRQAVGTFDRRAALLAGLAAAIRVSSPHFNPTVPTDGVSYWKGNDVDVQRAKADGFRFVLGVREEFGGMATAWEFKTLSATSTLKYELYDTSSGKRLGDGRISGFSTAKHDFEAGTTDGALFRAEYPAALGIACARIYGDLNKQGHLHTMAEPFGLGNEVPAIGAVLDKYARLFNYQFKAPRNWRDVKGASKYTMSFEPTSADRTKIGVVFSIDLLIDEFSQNVKTFDEYVSIFLGRLRGLGYGVDDAGGFVGLTLKTPHTMLLVDRPEGKGKEVVILRRLDNGFAIVYSVVLLDDPEPLLQKYRADIEALIDSAQITTRKG